MAILRLPLEPCIYYPEMTVHREIMSGLCGFMDALERFYRGWARGEAAVTQPPKQVYWRPDVRGDWRVMPCAVERGWPGSEGATSGIDAVKIIGTNEEERVVRDKISVGKALLLHPTDHHVEAIFDVAALSSFRTAAISVLAYKYGGHRHDESPGSLGRAGLATTQRRSFGSGWGCRGCSFTTSWILARTRSRKQLARALAVRSTAQVSPNSAATVRPCSSQRRRRSPWWTAAALGTPGSSRASAPMRTISPNSLQTYSTGECW